MDKVALGLRIAQARVRAGMTQGSLGEAIGLDYSAVSRLEKGERKLSALELVDIAALLERPLAYFIAEPVPAVVSRRRDSELAHESTANLDDELGHFAQDVRFMIDMGVLHGQDRRGWSDRVPQSHADAERLAADMRRRLGLDSGPIQDLGHACELLGLVAYAAPLGKSGADGGCVEVLAGASTALGAAVINGEAPSGRRRMTLAHELGHWLTGDAYDRGASPESEKLLQSFAVYFLAPRSGVAKVWRQNGTRDLRDRALTVSAHFRLSWSAAVSQLLNISLITRDDHDHLLRAAPVSGDFARLGLAWDDELTAPYLPRGLVASVLTAYTDERLTSERVLELLRGTFAEADLPDLPDLPDLEPLSLDAVRRSFDDHGEI